MIYKLRKSDLKGDLRESKHYLSNGHWLARKALLMYDYRIYPKELKDEAVERVIPKKTPLHIRRTNRIISPGATLERKDDIVVFEGRYEGDKGLTEVSFDRRYVEMFDLHELWGDDKDGAFTNDRETHDVIIMPKIL